MSPKRLPEDHEHLLAFEEECADGTEVYVCISCGRLFDGYMEPLQDAAEEVRA